MNEEQHDALRDDLIEIANKHNIKNAAFCGEHEGLFVGHFVGDTITYDQLWASVIVVGRLWQWARGLVKQSLDSLDKV